MQTSPSGKTGAVRSHSLHKAMAVQCPLCGGNFEVALSIGSGPNTAPSTTLGLCYCRVTLFWTPVLPSLCYLAQGAEGAQATATTASALREQSEDPTALQHQCPISLPLITRSYLTLKKKKPVTSQQLYVFPCYTVSLWFNSFPAAAVTWMTSWSK